jgi:hypothetical protein
VERLFWFWVLNTISIVGWVIIEIGLLMYFCAKYAVKVNYWGAVLVICQRLSLVLIPTAPQ